MLRVISPFGENLPRKAVPIPVQKRLSLGGRKHRQARKIFRVVSQQLLIVKYACRDEHSRFSYDYLRPVGLFHLMFFYYRFHRLACRYKPLLYPRMTRSARIRRGSDVHPRAFSARPVSRKHITVFIKGKLRQFIEPHKVIMLALIVKPVFLMLHRPEIDFSPGRKAPAVLGLVVPRRRICTFIKRLRPVLKLRQLRIRFPENYPPVASLIRLPERLRQKCVRLTSAGGTPVQSLILSPLHKLRLPFLRRPYHPPSAFYIVILHLSNTSRFSVNLSPSPPAHHSHTSAIPTTLSKPHPPSPRTNTLAFK